MTFYSRCHRPGDVLRIHDLERDRWLILTGTTPTSGSRATRDRFGHRRRKSVVRRMIADRRFGEDESARGPASAAVPTAPSPRRISVRLDSCRTRKSWHRPPLSAHRRHYHRKTPQKTRETTGNNGKRRRAMVSRMPWSEDLFQRDRRSAHLRQADS